MENAVISFFLVFYARIQEGKHSQEIAQFQAELAEARTQLQFLQKQLDEQLSKEPIGNQEVTHRGNFTAELDCWVAHSLHSLPSWKEIFVFF